MHFWKGYHVHGDFIQIDVKVSLKPHRASQVVDDVGDYRVLFLEVIFFFLGVTGLYHAGATRDIAGSPTLQLLSFLAHLGILRINPTHDVEKCLVVDGQNTVGVVDEHVKG